MVEVAFYLRLMYLRSHAEGRKAVEETCNEILESWAHDEYWQRCQLIKSNLMHECSPDALYADLF